MEELRLADGAEKWRLLRATYDNEVVVDFLYHNLMFCEEHGLDAHETSQFFDIARRVFDFTFGGGGEPVSIEKSFEYFKSLVLDSDFEQVDLIAQFLTTTFYRHFTAYTYCFSHAQPVQLDERTLVVDTPLPPLPLCQATMIKPP